ncbi:MAG: cell division protein FtsQ/DivIB [Symbiobacteriia bacterium]
MQSGFFRLERIVVTGNHRVSQDEVAVLTGVAPGAHLYSIRLEQVAKRLEQNPWVAKAVVSRGWPATLVVDVTERQPVALVPYYQYYLAVDQSGRALGLVQDLAALDVPVINGAPSNRVLLGHPYPVDKLKTALLCLRVLGKDWVPLVSDLDLQGDNGLTLYLEGPVEVQVGQDGDPAAKMQTLVTILADAKAKGLDLDRVDLRWDGQPVITLRNQKAAPTGPATTAGTGTGSQPEGGTK